MPTRSEVSFSPVENSRGCRTRLKLIAEPLAQGSHLFVHMLRPAGVCVLVAEPVERFEHFRLRGLKRGAVGKI
jgi:hypothetical protein